MRFATEMQMTATSHEIISQSFSPIIELKPTDIEAGKQFVSGWKAPEHDFIWSIGPESTVNIPLEPTSIYRGQNLKVAIELDVPVTPANPIGSELVFQLDGQVLFRQLTKGRSSLTFYVPSKLTCPRISLMHISNLNPALIDNLPLGFMLFTISLSVVPAIHEGDRLVFTNTSVDSRILGTGWKKPESAFTWSYGNSSEITLFFDANYCHGDPFVSKKVSFAKIILNVVLLDYRDPALTHLHILDFYVGSRLAGRYIYEGTKESMIQIPVFMPINPRGISDITIVDHSAISLASLGNDPNDHSILGFQLHSLEVRSIFTIPTHSIQAFEKGMPPIVISESVG
jgi:hypothetical protein